MKKRNFYVRFLSADGLTRMDTYERRPSREIWRSAVFPGGLADDKQAVAVENGRLYRFYKQEGLVLVYREVKL